MSTTYGSFNGNGHFEITNPRTPEPWLHYLIRLEQPGTETFCSGVSYTGGGFDVRGTHENTFVDTQLHLNDADNKGRYVYIKDVKTGEYFTTTWQPVRREGQEFTTTLKFGALTFESEYKGIETEETMFVPKDFDGWIKNITIRNNSKKKKTFEIFPFLPVHMGDALDRLLAGDNDGFFGGASWDEDLTSIVFRRNHGTNVSDDKDAINGMLGNVAAFVSTLNTADTEYETNEERFFGNRFNDLSNPDGVVKGKLSSTNQDYLRRTCGVYKNEVTLKHGEEVTFAVAMVAGSTQDYYLNNKAELKAIIEKIKDENYRTEQLQSVTGWWENHMEQLTVNSPDPKMNRAFKWLQYQCQVVYILNRMKSRYHTGYEYGWGFRDILQDVVFNLPYGAETVRDALKHISTQMFSTGKTYHNFFIDQPGNRDIEASDDPIWFPSAVIKYVKESGNFEFLDEVTNYAEVRENEGDLSGTILEHCKVAIDRVWTDRSDRNLPFMKDCDWNDDLNELRKEGKPNTDVESIMVAQQLYKGLIDMADLFAASGKDTNLIEEYQKRAATILEAIEKYAIDEEGYYIRALSLDPAKSDLGSSKNKEAKIFLETQAFGINCDVADESRSKIVMGKVEEYLDSEFGAQICYPVFTDLAENNVLPSRSWNIEKEPPAMKENGSIFMHLNAWLVQSYAKMGEGQKAVDFYTKCMPENLASDQDRYKSEPYIYPEYVRGRGGEGFGQGGHTWLTGTAPTMHQSLIEWVFGLQPEYDGLAIRPCVAPSWTEFAIKRNFRGATYDIKFHNHDGAENGIKTIKVDGEFIDGIVLPVFDDGKTHAVEVTMGEESLSLDLDL